MSSWSCVTFETGDRTVDAVAAELAGLVEDGGGHGDGAEPHTYEHRGNLVWRRKGSDPPPAALDVPRALDLRVNDTTDSAWGRLYERVDGRFVAVDRCYGVEGGFGRRVVDYFAVHHGLVGDTGV